MGDPETPAPGSGRGDELIQLWVLAGFAVAQPLFSVLAEDATFFVAHHARPGDLIGLALFTVIAPPLAWWLVCGLAGLAGRAPRRALHGGGVAVLMLVFVLAPLFRVGLPEAVSLGAGLLVAGLGTLFLLRSAAATTFMRILSPAPLVFAGLFLFGEPVNRLVAPDTPQQFAEPQAAPGAGGKSVLLLIMDEFPTSSLMNAEREVDPLLFPNLARLAAHSTWFRNATAVHDFTRAALPAILTGKYPDPEFKRLPTAGDHPENLVTLLAPTHRLMAREKVTALVPTELMPADLRPGADTGQRLAALSRDVGLVAAHVLIPEPFATGLPRIDVGWRDFGAPEDPPPDSGSGGDDDDDGSSIKGKQAFFDKRYSTTDDFREFIDATENTGDPTHFLHHTLLPHQPWMRLDTGQTYTRTWEMSGQERSIWVKDPWPSALAFQRHLLQVCHVDNLLGELLDKLEQEDLYDDMLIVLVADHGVSFRPLTHHREAREDNVDLIQFVPLFVKRPGQTTAAVSDRNVEVIDVLPTVADVLEIEIPFEIDGSSAFSDRPERPNKRLCRRDGHPLTLPGVVPESWPQLERKLQLFGSPDARAGLYAMGPWRDVVGRTLTATPDDGTAEVRALVGGAHRFDDVDLGADTLPCHILGTLDADPGTAIPAALAVVVNGRVAAVTQPYGRKGTSAEFSAVIPASALRDGANDVAIHALRGTPAAPTFQRLSPLLLSMSGGRLAFPDGRTLPIRPASNKTPGQVTKAEVFRNALEISGWTSDGRTGKGRDAPPGLIAVFEDGRFVFAQPVGAKQRYQTGSGKGSRKTAVVAPFRVSIPIELLQGDPKGRMTVLSVEGEEALTLSASKDATWVLRPDR